MQFEQAFYRLRLEQELARRCEGNPRYSLRSFARALRIDVGNLSRVLAGKSTLSFKMAQKIAGELGLSPEETKLFISSLAEEQKTKKLNGLGKHVSREIQKAALQPTLDIELFRIIGDWYHCAILELTYVEGFKSDFKWIAQQLGISAIEAKLAVSRLRKLGLLEQNNGVLKKTHAHITTRDKHLTTPALRKLQKQLLEKAIYSLENIPIEQRNQSGMTMPIDPKNMPIAKKLIEEFSESLSKLMAAGKKKKVYQLSVSLFPLQVEESK